MSDILLLLDGRNADLFADWIIEETDHTVITDDPANIPEDRIDICIVDGGALREHEGTLRSLKDAESPVFFPIVLIISKDRYPHGIDRIRSEPQYKQLIDDELSVPIEKVALARRLNVLLRIREQSKALKQSETRFRALVDQNLSGIFMIAKDRFEYVNRRFATLFGYAQEELMGAPVAKITREDGRNGLVAAVLNTGQTDPTVLRQMVVDRDRRGDHLDLIVEAHWVPSDETDIVIGTVVDISEQVAAERRAADRADQLAMLNQIIRHDVRNDLAVILGWGEMLYEHVDDDGRDIVDRIIHAGRHTHDLTLAARDFSRLLDESADVGLEAVNLSDILRAEITTVEARFANSVKSVDIDPPDPFPDVVEVPANEMLTSVFHNLLTNAVVHADTGAVEIDIGLSIRDDSVSVSIADNGPGIPADLQDTLFQRETKGLESGGSGLGLYLVDRLVSAFDGRVEVAANEPRGAVFTVTLPRA